MESNIDPLAEWAVWGHLDRKNDLELILLKGHLLLEKVIETVLERNNIQSYKNFSFYKKILTLEKIEFNENEKKEFIIKSLKNLNKMRNALAHEFSYRIDNDIFELWSENVLKKLKGTKFTKYTYRTKKVHSFSSLTINILELE